MTIPAEDSRQVLQKEILADARRQGERALQRARREADDLLARAQETVDQERQKRMKAAHEEAERLREQILATVVVETARLRGARVEEVLHSVYEEARQALDRQRGEEYRDILVTLAALAIRGMDGERFVVELDEQDAAMSQDDFVDAIRRQVERNNVDIQLAYTARNPGGGGVVVRDAEGRRVWDNRLSARLQRLWPDLRGDIARQLDLVEDVTSPGGAV